MNTRLKGKEFEKDAFEYLKSQFDKVEWLSEKQLSTFDFKCSKNDKEYYIEAKYLTIRNKFNSKIHLPIRQKDADFIITNSRNGLVLIPNNQFNQEVKLEKDSITIKVDHNFKLWLRSNRIEKESYEETILRLIGLKKE